MLKRNKPNNMLPQFTDGTTIIAAGTSVTGDLESINALRIDGSVHGNIKGTSKVIVGQQGIVTGNISAIDVTILGRLTGSIEAQSAVALRGKANIEGDIFTKMLTIEPEVYFNGRCNMDGSSLHKMDKMVAINGFKKAESVN
jgi:cytoskeletal protein CcmA (bactofilin family)